MWRFWLNLFSVAWYVWSSPESPYNIFIPLILSATLDLSWSFVFNSDHSFGKKYNSTSVLDLNQVDLLNSSWLCNLVKTWTPILFIPRLYYTVKYHFNLLIKNILCSSYKWYTCPLAQISAIVMATPSQWNGGGGGNSFRDPRGPRVS